MSQDDEPIRSEDDKPTPQDLVYAVHPRVQNGSVCMAIVHNGALAHDVMFTPAAARALGAEFFQAAAEAEEWLEGLRRDA